MLQVRKNKREIWNKVYRYLPQYRSLLLHLLSPLFCKTLKGSRSLLDSIHVKDNFIEGGIVICENNFGIKTTVSGLNEVSRRTYIFFFLGLTRLYLYETKRTREYKIKKKKSRDVRRNCEGLLRP